MRVVLFNVERREDIDLEEYQALAKRMNEFVRPHLAVLLATELSFRARSLWPNHLFYNAFLFFDHQSKGASRTGV